MGVGIGIGINNIPIGDGRNVSDALTDFVYDNIVKPFQNGPGKQALKNNPDFRRWFHREYKPDCKKDGNPDLTDEELDEAYYQWLAEGRPTVK